MANVTILRALEGFSARKTITPNGTTDFQAGMDFTFEVYRCDDLPRSERGVRARRTLATEMATRTLTMPKHNSKRLSTTRASFRINRHGHSSTAE